MPLPGCDGGDGLEKTCFFFYEDMQVEGLRGKEGLDFTSSLVQVLVYQVHTVCLGKLKSYQ